MTIAIVVACLLVLVPVAAVNTLPLQDLPNHVARVFILATLENSEHLQKYYEVAWDGVANLATEAVLLTFSIFFDWNLSEKLLVVVTLLAIPAGVLILNKSLFGAVQPQALLIFVFTYNYTFIFGFISYLIGVGLFLLLFASWLRSATWQPLIRIGTFNLLATGLMFSHLYGLGLYGLTVMAYETGLVISGWRKNRRLSISSWMRAASQFVLPLALFLALSSTVEQAAVTSWSDLADKWHYYQKIFLVIEDLIPNHTTDSGNKTNMLLSIVLLSMIAIGLMTQRLKLELRMLFPILAVTGAFLFMPKIVFSSWAADDRMPIAVIALLLASIRVEAGRIAKVAIATVAVAILSQQILTITSQWSRYDTYYDEYFTALQQLPQGTRLSAAIGYTGSILAVRTPPILHIGNRVITEKQGFFTTIFANPGQQTIRLREPYDSVQLNYNIIVFHAQYGHLEEKYLTEVRPPFGNENLNHYDYFLWVRPHLFPIDPPSTLEPVFRGSDFILYKIQD